MKMQTSMALIGFLLLMLTASPIYGLKCYQCGTYSTTGAGSVSPCYTYDESNLKQCGPADTHCLKYVNEGIIVRQCVPSCKTGVEGVTALYCCQEDGCNSASLTKPHLLALASVVAVVAIFAARQ